MFYIQGMDNIITLKDNKLHSISETCGRAVQGHIVSHNGAHLQVVKHAL